VICDPCDAESRGTGPRESHVAYAGVSLPLGGFPYWSVGRAHSASGKSMLWMIVLENEKV